MPYQVAAFYQFASLPDFRELREPLRAVCARLKLKGSVLLAHEGINGTLAGEAETIGDFVTELRDGGLFGGRIDRLELKFSQSSAMPFQRLKVRLKKEIVTLGDASADPTRQVGTYVEPADWNALIEAPDTLMIDTRNAFEVALGTFDGAVDPGIKSFGQFKEFTARHLDPAKHQRIAMFCTGGIRCEKASAYLLAHGFAEVYQLSRGGILRYLEGVPEARSRWRGRMFCVRRPHRPRPTGQTGSCDSVWMYHGEIAPSSFLSAGRPKSRIPTPARLEFLIFGAAVGPKHQIGGLHA